MRTIKEKKEHPRLRKTARTKKVTHRKLSSGPGKRDTEVLSCRIQPLAQKAVPWGRTRYLSLPTLLSQILYDPKEFGV